VFLFDNTLMLCKQRDDTTAGASPPHVYYECKLQIMVPVYGAAHIHV
jgi:hypothetical protein